MASWLSKNRQRVVEVIGTLLAISLLVYLIDKGGWDEIVTAMRQIIWRTCCGLPCFLSSHASPLPCAGMFS
jgi:hypothetical protein